MNRRKTRIAVNNPRLILPKRTSIINLKFKVMKKKFSLYHSGTYRGFFNLFHGVRVMIFLMLVGLTHVSATASSQNAVINLKLKDVSLEEAVRSAEKQLKQDFFFNKQEILNRDMKEELRIKEPIKLRVKHLANGNKSIYLDMYMNGKRKYEFLNYILYLNIISQTGCVIVKR